MGTTPVGLVTNFPSVVGPAAGGAVAGVAAAAGPAAIIAGAVLGIRSIANKIEQGHYKQDTSKAQQEFTDEFSKLIDGLRTAEQSGTVTPEIRQAAQLAALNSWNGLAKFLSEKGSAGQHGLKTMTYIPPMLQGLGIPADQIDLASQGKLDPNNPGPGNTIIPGLASASFTNTPEPGWNGLPDSTLPTLASAAGGAVLDSLTPPTTIEDVRRSATLGDVGTASDPPAKPKSLLDRLLPYLVQGGTSIVSGVLGSNAAKDAAKLQAAGGNKALDTIRLNSQEQMDLLRKIYNTNVGLQWPQYRTGTAALSMLNRGMGTGVPDSAYSVPENPPQLQPFTPPGTEPPPPDQIPPGMARGGATRPAHSYIVGEKGPEEYVPDHPGIPPALVGVHGEEVFTPPYDGRIIPHNKLVGRAEGGEVKSKWIQGAVSHPGSFTAAAERANMGTQEFAAHVLAHKDKFSPTTIRRAALARTFAAMAHRGSGGPVLTGQPKVEKVMHEFKTGALNSSSGQPVTNRKQAIAIALSEAGLSRRARGGQVAAPQLRTPVIPVSRVSAVRLPTIAPTPPTVPLRMLPVPRVGLVRQQLIPIPTQPNSKGIVTWPTRLIRRAAGGPVAGYNFNWWDQNAAVPGATPAPVNSPAVAQYDDSLISPSYGFSRPPIGGPSGIKTPPSGPPPYTRPPIGGPSGWQTPMPPVYGGSMTGFSRPGLLPHRAAGGDVSGGPGPIMYYNPRTNAYDSPTDPGTVPWSEWSTAAQQRAGNRDPNNPYVYYNFGDTKSTPEVAYPTGYKGAPIVPMPGVPGFDNTAPGNKNVASATPVAGQGGAALPTPQSPTNKPPAATGPMGNPNWNQLKNVGQGIAAPPPTPSAPATVGPMGNPNGNQLADIGMGLPAPPSDTGSKPNTETDYNFAWWNRVPGMWRGGPVTGFSRPGALYHRAAGGPVYTPDDGTVPPDAPPPDLTAPPPDVPPVPAPEVPPPVAPPMGAAPGANPGGPIANPGNQVAIGAPPPPPPATSNVNDYLNNLLGPGGPKVANIEGPPAGPGGANQDLIGQWGWAKDPQGNWKNKTTGDSGHWTSGGQFVNDTQGKIFDPNTGQLSNYQTGSALPPNPYATMGQNIPSGPGKPGQTQGDWLWDDSQGLWWNPKAGNIYDPKTDMISDPNNPNRQPWSRYNPTPGEFMQPWGGEFNFDPTSAGFQSFSKPFSFDPAAAGYQPFNKQFSFDPAAAGYSPLNAKFSFDPAAGGFQPLNKPFSFNAADLMKDPSYQFRLDQGNQAIERSAAARGMLDSGATLKALDRYSQDYASTEYGKAYDRAQSEFNINRQAEQTAYSRAMSEFGLSQTQAQNAYARAQAEFTQNSGLTKDAYVRALQEHGLNYAQAIDAYNRALAEYTQKYNIFEANQATRFNRLQAIAGGGQVAANQIGAAGTNTADITAAFAGKSAAEIADLQTQVANAQAGGVMSSSANFQAMLARLGITAFEWAILGGK